LGNWLRRYKDKVSNNLRLKKSGIDTHSKVFYWQVVQLQSAGSAGSAESLSNPARKNGEPVQNIGICHFPESRLKVTPQDPADPANDPPEPASPSVDTNDKEIF
jgi:hypothetical protein